ncbi:GNAT family N-acetyltransferase [Actinomadura fibrosa]|uniref:GNAT family N-acetyltransferase n=1 Tax=Actinomadura fibrosa TaxID=111802 RepID=A0ABW2XJJ6_9ACTN|nr:GNAT family N-acetyltransferase [Actinomadura fibrosa]
MGLYFFPPSLKLRATFLAAQAEYAEHDGRPDADGLTLADLTEGTLRSYVEGMAAGTFPRDGIRIGVAGTELWWCETSEGQPPSFVGRLTVRHDLVAANYDRGGQLWLSIRPSRRRQGLGTQLLAAALPIAAAHGITTPVVVIRTVALAPRKLAESVGGKQVWEKSGRVAYRIESKQQVAV